MVASNFPPTGGLLRSWVMAAAALLVALSGCGSAVGLRSNGAALVSSAVSLYGCNADALAQLPSSPNLFLGRILANGDPTSCAGNQWELTLLSMDWTSRKLSLVRTVFATPQTIGSGQTITSAYDPSAVSYEGETWVSFECAGTGITTSAACVGPLSPNGAIDAARTVVAVNGASYSPQDSYNHSASHPFLFAFKGSVYMYWTAVQILKSDFNNWLNLTSRGARMTQEASGAKRLFVAGSGDSTIQSDDPNLTTEVLGLKSGDPRSDRTADFFQVISLADGMIYVTMGLGGGTCTSPNAGGAGCYRLAISRTTEPLALDGFNQTVYAGGGLPDNPEEYSRFVTLPDGSVELMGMMLNPKPPTAASLPGGFQSFAVPNDPFFTQPDQPVTGVIDGVFALADGSHVVSGWACNQHDANPIEVALYLGQNSALGIGWFPATNASEPAVAAACQSTGTAYRYAIPVDALAAQHPGLPIFVYGISRDPNAGNAGLTNSGKFTLPGGSPPPPPPPPPVIQAGPIEGNVHGLVQTATGYAVDGWACAQGDPAPIDVDVYLGGPAGSGTALGRFLANDASEPAVAQLCQASGSTYRFHADLLASDVAAHAGQPLYVHGISPNGHPNALLNGSGGAVLPSAATAPIVGNIDGVGGSGPTVEVSGWACAKTWMQPVRVDLYLGGPAGSGTGFASAQAALQSEPAVAAACGSLGQAYRFSIPLAGAPHGKSIFIHGISPFGFGNDLLNQSGKFVVP